MYSLLFGVTEVWGWETTLKTARHPKTNKTRHVKKKKTAQRFSRLTHHVERLMYCFQESLPDSLPPPVCFSPPRSRPGSCVMRGYLGNRSRSNDEQKWWPTESPSDLGSARGNVDVHNAAVWSLWSGGRTGTHFKNYSSITFFQIPRLKG